MLTILRVACPPNVPMVQCVADFSEEVGIQRCFCPQTPAAENSRRRQRNSNDDDDDKKKKAAVASAADDGSATAVGGSGANNKMKQLCEQCLVQVASRIGSTAATGTVCSTSSFFFALDPALSITASASSSSSSLSDQQHQQNPLDLPVLAAARGNVTLFGRLPSLPVSQRLLHTHASRVHFMIECFDLSVAPSATDNNSNNSSTVQLPLSRVQHVFRTLAAWLNTVPSSSNMFPPCEHYDSEQQQQPQSESKAVDFYQRCRTAYDQINRWFAQQQQQQQQLLTVTATSMQNDTFINGKPLPRWIPIPLLVDDVIDALTVPTIIIMAADEMAGVSSCTPSTTAVGAKSNTVSGPGTQNQQQQQHQDDDDNDEGITQQDVTPASPSPMATARSKNRDPLPRFVVTQRERSPERPMAGQLDAELSRRRQQRRSSSMAASP